MVRHSLEKLNEVLIGPNGEVSIASMSDLVLTGSITEAVYTLTGVAIDPSNGTMQIKAMPSGATVFDMAAILTGQSVNLRVTGSVDAGASVTWNVGEWVGGVAPTLTNNDQIRIWNDGTGVKGHAEALA